MKVPFRLRKRAVSDPAAALLVPRPDATELLRICAGLGLDPSGRVFDVAGGFLLRLDAPTSQPMPGAIRLRALAENLLVPVDADLVPALLDDEASGLGRDRGLVFLPWGGVLGFDPHSPRDPRGLLVADVLSRRDWRPLPERPALADRLEEIVVDRPDESPESVLDAGGDEIASEPPRPEESPPRSKIMGAATLGAGRGMQWLGKTLGLKGLADLGAGMVGDAMAMAPRLSEAVLGRQAAALRALLKEFREGDPDRALRRALPLGEPGGTRGATPDAGDALPVHDLSYSLDDLLGPPSRRSSGVWHGSQDVLSELTREYRKAAERASARGDHRRAACIYGKLLRDYRMAAHELLHGGLHHDAAVLLLAKLDDPRAAARAFEAAGEVDRAVQLYRRVNEHEAAGDLLRRIGEEDAALTEYRRAASMMTATGAGFLAAGRLMLKKAGRADLALAYYREGWKRRPDQNARACAEGALALLAEARAFDELTVLLDEADAYLTASGHVTEVSLYYNFLARLPVPAEVRESLRDRALVGLAAKLRQQARPGTPPGRLVTELFGQSNAWPAALIGDADHAAKEATRELAPPAPAAPRATRFRIGKGLVTAVCAAPDSDEIFVGFEGGDVYCFRPSLAEVVRVAAYDLPVASLSAHPDGRSLVILRAGRAQVGALSAYARSPDGSYRLLLGTPLDDLVSPWLTPVLPTDREDLVGIWDGQGLYLTAVASLVSRGRSLTLPRPDAAPTAALLVPSPAEEGPGCSVAIHDGREWCLVDLESQAYHRSGLSWNPGYPVTHPLRSVSPSWAWGDADHLEVAGLDGHGILHWAAFQLEAGRFDLLAANTAAQAGGYLAAAVVRPRLVAGVTRSRVEWRRCDADRFSFSSSTEVAIPSALACFPCRRTGELIVLCDDGFVARVTIPFGP